MFALQQEGPGTTIVNNLNIIKSGAVSTTRYAFLVSSVTTGFSLSLHDNMIDGNGISNITGIRCQDKEVTLNIYNNVVWNPGVNSRNGIALVVETSGNDIVENNTVYGFSTAFNVGGLAVDVRNNVVLGSGTADYGGIAAATGRNNASGDLTAANGNWAVGTNNLTGIVAGNCFQSVNDALATFLDILTGGTLDGAGIANAIVARVTGVRGRAVPGPNGTSIGAAEVPPATPTPGGRGRAGYIREFYHRMMSPRI